MRKQRPTDIIDTSLKRVMSIHVIYYLSQKNMTQKFRLLFLLAVACASIEYAVMLLLTIIDEGV